jgi:hypothetical protein
MTIGKKPWLPNDPSTDLTFGAKAKSFDLFTPPPDGQWQLVPSDAASQETVSLRSTLMIRRDRASLIRIPYSA